MSLTATDRPRGGVISHHQTQLASTCAFFPMFNASGMRGTRAAQSVPKEGPLHTLVKNCTYCPAFSGTVCRHLPACKEPLQYGQVGFPQGCSMFGRFSVTSEWVAVAYGRTL